MVGSRLSPGRAILCPVAPKPTFHTSPTVRTLHTSQPLNGTMFPVGDPEVPIFPAKAADTPRRAHDPDTRTDAESGEVSQTTDNSSSTVNALDVFGSGGDLGSSLFADCFGIDGSYTISANLFPGSPDTTDTYAWALASGEAQAGVSW